MASASSGAMAQTPTRNMLSAGQVTGVAADLVTVSLHRRRDRPISIDVPTEADIGGDSDADLTKRYKVGDGVFVRYTDSSSNPNFNKLAVLSICKECDLLTELPATVVRCVTGIGGVICDDSDMTVCHQLLESEPESQASFMMASYGPNNLPWNLLLSAPDPSTESGYLRSLVDVFPAGARVIVSLMPQPVDRFGRRYTAVRIRRAGEEQNSSTSNSVSSSMSPAELAGRRLPVDRSNLVVYDGSGSRSSIGMRRRAQQPDELHDQLFVVVDFVDTTRGQCMHAFSGTCGHGVLVLDDFEENLRPIGTWFRASVVKIHDLQLDPIIWQIVSAHIVSWPTDQWDSPLEVVDIGRDGECILKCRALVSLVRQTHDGMQLDAFNDVIHRMTTGRMYDAAAVNVDQWPRNGDACCVEVHARFTMMYHDVPWRIVKLTTVPSAPSFSDQLLTSDAFTAVRLHDDFVFAHHAVLGDVFAGLCELHGHEATRRLMKSGDKLRVTFARQLHNRDLNFRVVRASILSQIGQEAAHPPINCIDSMSVEQQRRLLDGGVECGSFVRALGVTASTNQRAAPSMSTNQRAAPSLSTNQRAAPSMPTNQHAPSPSSSAFSGRPHVKAGGRGLQRMATPAQFQAQASTKSPSPASDRSSLPPAIEGIGAPTESEDRQLLLQLRECILSNQQILQEFAKHSPEVMVKIIAIAEQK